MHVDDCRKTALSSPAFRPYYADAEWAAGALVDGDYAEATLGEKEVRSVHITDIWSNRDDAVCRRRVGRRGRTRKITMPHRQKEQAHNISDQT